jgi:hypothetical protein
MNGHATDYYAETARKMVFESIGDPCYETCAAAYLIGLADWGAGDGKRSWMMQGTAIRSEQRSATLSNLTDASAISGVFAWPAPGKNTYTS